MALQARHVGIAPEVAEAILALGFALTVGDAKLTKIAIFFKLWLWLLWMATPLDLPYDLVKRNFK